MKQAPQSLRQPLVLLLTTLCIVLSLPAFAGEEKPKVTLFSIDFCPSCLAAKKHFEEQDIPYQEFNIQDNQQAREAFDRLGGRGTPFIYVEGKTMNGFHPQRFDQLWAEVTAQ